MIQRFELDPADSIADKEAITADRHPVHSADASEIKAAVKGMGTENQAMEEQGTVTSEESTFPGVLISNSGEPNCLILETAEMISMRNSWPPSTFRAESATPESPRSRGFCHQIFRIQFGIRDIRFCCRTERRRSRLRSMSLRY